MEVTPGYKQTSAGPLPVDWDIVPLGESLVGRPRYGINAAAVPFSDQLPTYIRITDISTEGQFAPAELVSVDAAGASDYFLGEGDIVFARTGASVGKSYRYRREDGQLVFAGFLIRVRPDPEHLLPAFLAAYVMTGPYWSWVRLMSMRSGQPGINGNEYAQLPVPIPPLPEQRAIATALSDVDSLLDGLERLITKKRDLKQAAMQQLLSGQTRLPGFHGEWEVKRIGDFARCIAGGTPSTKVASYWGGAIKWMSSGELNLRYVDDVEGRITEAGLHTSSATMLPKRCVLIGLAGQGKTRGTVAMNLVELCTNQSIAAVLPDPEFVPEYLYYNLDARYEELREMSTGAGGRGGLNLTIIKAVVVPFPKFDEQKAIAAVLGDIDAELAALERRRGKTRDLKQGMMQELLTGKTRLVPTGGADA